MIECRLTAVCLSVGQRDNSNSYGEYAEKRTKPLNVMEGRLPALFLGVVVQQQVLPLLVSTAALPFSYLVSEDHFTILTAERHAAVDLKHRTGVSIELCCMFQRAGSRRQRHLFMIYLQIYHDQ